MSPRKPDMPTLPTQAAPWPFSCTEQTRLRDLGQALRLLTRHRAFVESMLDDIGRQAYAELIGQLYAGIALSQPSGRETDTQSPWRHVAALLEVAESGVTSLGAIRAARDALAQHAAPRPVAVDQSPVPSFIRQQSA